MKLRSVEIENFGMFSGRTFDFEGDGVQLLFGANEAGKSTLLQLVRELLFGFPARSPYAFADHAGEMAATATVEMSNGTEVQFRRRKGRKGEVVGRIESSNRDIDAAGLSRLLGGANADLYGHVFGFSLQELASGEKSLKHANLSEALYGGSLGGLANFQAVQAGLKEEADNLFTPKGRTAKIINKLQSEIKQKNAELRKATVKPRDYEKLRASKEELDQKVAELRESLDAFRRRQAHLQRIADALPLWLRQGEAQRELSGLNVPDGFPADGAKELARLKKRREELAGELAEYEQELAEKTQQLESLKLDPEIVACESEIRELAKQVSEIEGYRRDLPLRQQECDEIKSSVLARLRELNPDWDQSQLDQFKTSLAQRDTIERLKQERDELDRRHVELTAQRPAVENDVRLLSESLKALEPVGAPTRLEVFVDGESKYRANCDKRDELAEELRELDAQIGAMSASLNGPLHAELEFQQPLPVPMEPTVIEFRTRLSEAQEAVRQATQEVDQLRQDCETNAEQLAQWDAQQAVPDRNQLLDERERRDTGWGLIRQKYIDSAPIDDRAVSEWIGQDGSSLPDEYERAVGGADQLADQRQDKAEAVAHHDQLALKIERLDRRRQAAEDELAKRRTEWEQANTDWQTLWDKCGFEPLSPEAMLDWLRQYGDLLQKQTRRNVANDDLETLTERIGQFECELRSVLDDSSDSIEHLSAKARDMVRAARDAVTQRKMLETQLAQKEEDLRRLNDDLAKVEDSQADWQGRWKPLLEQFGFPADWDVHLATRILNGLSEARTEHKQSISLVARMQDMQAGVERFERRVTDMCEQVASDLLRLPVETAIMHLADQRVEAIQAETDREKLTADKTRLQGRTKTKQKQLDEVKAKWADLLAAAGAETEEQFQHVADQAQRHAELARILVETQQEINAVRSTEDEEQFRTELEQADADTVDEQRRRLEEETQIAEAAYEAKREDQIRAADRLTDMEGASSAADTAMELENARSQLASAVDRWVPLVLAQSLMNRAIDKFEREHQPAMLNEVQRLFRLLTLERYAGIERKLDEQGTLLVVEQSGRRKEPSELSTGTREQLYLAIRLAYITHYCRDAEPLPMVMDDVLVNFDDERATQTLRVLSEIAEEVQVIFLTCHQHMVDLARQVQPACKPTLLPAEC